MFKKIAEVLLNLFTSEGYEGPVYLKGGSAGFVANDDDYDERLCSSTYDWDPINHYHDSWRSQHD